MQWQRKQMLMAGRQKYSTPPALTMRKKRGSVSAGIDYSKVHISIDESTKEIIITLPTPQILDATVDMGSLEYIFLDEDYETESVAIDAYRLCVSSLQQRVETEEKLLSMAKESAIDTTRALFEPLLGQVDSGYVLVIR